MPQKKKVIKKVSPKKKEAPKPVRKQGEGPLQYYKRWKKWSDNRPGMDRKPVKPAPKKPSKKVKPKKKLTEREKRIKQRKDAEKLLGIKRGVKKKKSKKKDTKKKKSGYY